MKTRSSKPHHGVGADEQDEDNIYVILKEKLAAFEADNHRLKEEIKVTQAECKEILKKKQEIADAA